jgi:hypothetical protein
MDFLLGSVGAVRAGELWLLPALVALMCPETRSILVALATTLTDKFTCHIIKRNYNYINHKK